MLRDSQHSLQTINDDPCANAMMICSSVFRVFCVGADLKELCLPTISVIGGSALGGGLVMALSCDLQIYGEDAILALPETGLAIIPALASCIIYCFLITVKFMLSILHWS